MTGRRLFAGALLFLALAPVGNGTGPDADHPRAVQPRGPDLRRETRSLPIDLPPRTNPQQGPGLPQRPLHTERFRRCARTAATRVSSRSARRAAERACACACPTARRSGSRSPTTRNGGPVLSGPQLQPWVCQARRVDAQCNQPPSTATSTSRPTRPSRGCSPTTRTTRPSDVATTTTDQGVTRAVHRPRRDRLPGPRPVPDRDALPARRAVAAVGAAEAVEPQAADHSRRVAAASTTRPAARPDVTSSGRPSTPSAAAEYALGKGFATMSTALDNTGHNCNVAAPGRVADHGQGAPRRALRRAPLHDRHRLLGRLARAPVDRQRLPRHLPGHPADAARSPTRGARRRSSSTTT